MVFPQTLVDRRLLTQLIIKRILRRRIVIYTAIILIEIVIFIVAIVVLVYFIGLIRAATDWLKNDNDRKGKMFSLDYQLKSMDLKDRTMKEQYGGTAHQTQRTQNTQDKDYVFYPMCGERNSKENDRCQKCGYQLK